MITVFGSINLDLVLPVPHLPASGETVLGPRALMQPGGKGANQAVAAARDGATVAMVGAVGQDPLADAATELLDKYGVDLSRVMVVDAPTACAAVLVDSEGHNAIAVGSGANALVKASQVEDAMLSGTVVLQMEVPAEETVAVIERARRAGGRILLNLAPAAPLPEAALKTVDFLIVNETEAAWLAEHLGCAVDAVALRRRLDGVTVLMTLGAEGVAIGDAAAEETGVWTYPALPVIPVDTTAAGDCFVGVLASRLDAGDDLRQALAAATSAAGICCARRGSQISLPERRETEIVLSVNEVW